MFLLLPHRTGHFASGRDSFPLRRNSPIRVEQPAMLYLSDKGFQFAFVKRIEIHSVQVTPSLVKDDPFWRNDNP